MVIDARGLGCPKPVMMAQEALSWIQDGIVEVLVDNYGSSENVLMFAQSAGCLAEVPREGQDFPGMTLIRCAVILRTGAA